MGPVLLGIGVPRGGSTWLASLLASHDDIVAAHPVKEVRYFDRHHERGTAWYRSMFPDALSEGKLALDFSPQYLYSRVALDRVARATFVTDVVAVLRAPWERAWSEHLHIQRMSASTDDFRQAVRRHPEILERGFYAPHLEAWRRRLGPDRVKICVLEELAARPTEEVGRLLAELGLERAGWRPPTGADRNAGFVPRSRVLHAVATGVKQRIRARGWKRPLAVARRPSVQRLMHAPGRAPALPAELRADLIEQYRPSVVELERLLGRPTPWLAVR